jgi:CO/xanthine dehydrogenase FAD-binding subunit
MDAPHSQVFFPASFQELFSAWARYPDAIPLAGGTGLLGKETKHTLSLPRNILSLSRLEELRRITRTERYLEIGAAVKINDIINLGKTVPEALSMTLKGIAGLYIRNLATIGGNICHSPRRMDAAAPLIALDARYELRSALQSRWISASRFSSLPGPPALDPRELLTRIRIPLEEWNYTVYRKFTCPGNIPEGAAVFIARIQKNILTDIRMVFAGQFILRDKNSETALEGRQLPLDRKDAAHFTGFWESYLSAVEIAGEGGLFREPAMFRKKLLNFINSSILGLAD